MVLPPDPKVLSESTEDPRPPIPGRFLAQTSDPSSSPNLLQPVVALRCRRPGVRLGVPLGITLGPWSPLSP